MSWSKSIVAVGVIALTACGFEPLYVKRKPPARDDYYLVEEPKAISPQQQLALINVSPIENVMGQQLRRYLRNRLNPKGLSQSPLYVLKIEIDDPTTRTGLRMDNTATRETYIFRANYSLYKGGKILVEGKASTEASYNILDAPYSTIVSERESRQRAAKLLAEDISLRLGVFFRDKIESSKEQLP